MKKTIALIGLLSLSAFAFSQKTYVPDNNFEKYLIVEGYDDELDDSVLTSEAEKVGGLYLSNRKIASLEGIQAFVNIGTLNFDNNLVSEVDLSKNTNLITLGCKNNKLTALDLSGNIKLNSFNCSDNFITDLLLNTSGSIAGITCQNNMLTDLDLSKALSLKFLAIGNNKLNILDISNLLLLEELSVNNNFLETIIFGENIKLTNLVINNNLLTSVNVTRLRALTSFFCFKNQLTSLDVTRNYKLYGLICSNNKLTSLDLSQNDLLVVIDCSDNLLTKLSVVNNNIAPVSETFNATNNPNLLCIEVVNVQTAINSEWRKDASATFATDCGTFTGLAENNNQMNFSLFPNPSEGRFTIEFNEDEQSQLSIYNATGELVISKNIKNGDQITLTDRGVYMLKLESNKGVSSRKVIVK